jgi:transglutaminase-like putative cysteine protease
MDKSSGWLEVLLQDWQRRLTAFISLIFLLQIVSWIASEDSLWWPETVTIVKLSLYLTFVLELLPRKNVLFIRCLQITALLAVNAIYSNYKLALYGIHSMKDFGNLVYDNFWQLHPFIWFSLGAWLAYTAAVWCMISRWRIGAVTVISVLVLAIRDSFSLLTLWEETAMVILCGLLLLVVRHFSEIKSKNPDGWAYLAEYPGTLLVTIAVLLGITFIPGLMMPGVRPLLTDPYSAYLQWKGEEVPSFGKALFGEGGLLSSGSSSSGYSRDDTSLGGGFDFDYSPVFTVDTTHRSYYRGETRSFYNGSGWEQSEGDKGAASTPVSPDAGLTRDPRFNTSLLKTIPVRQTVTVLREDDSYPVLFGAYSISKVESVNGEKAVPDRLRWSPRQSELRWNESGRTAYPETYVVESLVPVVNDAELQKAVDIPNRNQFAEYLQLPRDLPARVRQLAADVTAGAATPYDKAKKLEAYLQSTFPYTNKPHSELGKSKDFVDRFLFEIKEGYCDYFSSSMAVLSRAAGIPSRWVKGYVSGYNNLEDISFGQIPIEIMDPDAAGTYTVRNSDAHSWVELYFPGYGWIPFEPTSGFVLPSAQLPAEDLPAVELPDAGTAADSAEGEESSYSSLWIWISGSVIVAAAGLALLWYFRDRLPRLTGAGRLLSRRRTSDPNQRVVLEYNKLMKRYRRRGVPLYDHETARETILRLKKKDVWLSDDLEQLLALFEKAKYSPRGVSPEESGRASAIVEKLRKAM